MATDDADDDGDEGDDNNDDGDDDDDDDEDDDDGDDDEDDDRDDNDDDGDDYDDGDGDDDDDDDEDDPIRSNAFGNQSVHCSTANRRQEIKISRYGMAPSVLVKASTAFMLPPGCLVQGLTLVAKSCR